MKFRKEDSPKGDLAQDMECDRTFPKKAKRYDTILNYLESRTSWEPVLNAFKRSYNDYKKFIGEENK